jgi:O-antigen/teichoic acid export membrane protein
MGISLALTKRISEGENKSQHLITGLFLITAAFVIITVGVYATRDYVNQYLGDELYIHVIILLGADMLYLFVSAVMKGERLVHIQGVISLCETILRVLLQILAVIFGLGAVGLVLGQATATAVLAVLAAIMVVTYFGRSIDIKKPEHEHYRSLLEYAKFSWLGDIKGSIYQRMDIIVLGLFVPSNLIGIYSICWNIASILEIFGKSLSTTMFPEMSKTSINKNSNEIKQHLENALTYSGLIIIPGFVGIIIVGTGILNIYGREFKKGYEILVILVGSTLVHSYYKQLINTIDAINRPDMTFNINIIFIILNIFLNIILVYFYGWTGAAIATFISVVAAMLIAYQLLSSIVDFSVPYAEILRQVSSAIIMGFSAYLLMRAINLFDLNTQRLLPVLVTVIFSVLTYSLCLLLISKSFRGVIIDNLDL